MQTGQRLTFCCIFLFLCSVTKAQEAFKGTSLADHMLIKEMDQSLYGTPEARVDGSPYLNDAYVEGKVVSNGATFTDVPLRYNVYQDNFEFKQNDQVYILDPDKRIQKIEVGERTFVVAKSDVIGKMKDSFFQQLDSGKVQLLLKRVIIFKDAQAPKALESASTPAKYQPLPDQYFFRFGNGEIEKITSIKKMIAAFPDQRDELNEFARKEKISPRNQEELIRLVRFYNSR